MSFLSNLFSGIGKVISGGGGLLKRIGSSIFGAASAFFTFGGSLSLGGITGGWSDAISTVVDQLGLGGTPLGNILGGAVKHAGFGGLAGAAGALLSGGDVGKGATRGALAGGLLGGIGAMGDMAGTPAPGIAARAAGGAPSSIGVGALGVPANVAGSTMASGAAVPTGPAAGGLSGLFGEGGWLERNAAWLGPIASNVGGAIMEGQAAEDQIRLQERMEASRRHTIPRIWGDNDRTRAWGKSERPAPPLHPSMVY